MAGLRDVQFKGFRQVVPDGQYKVSNIDVAEFNGHAYIALIVKNGDTEFGLSLNSLCMKVYPVPNDGEPIICSRLGTFNTELAEAVAKVASSGNCTCGQVVDGLASFKGSKISLHSVSHTVLTYDGGTVARTFYSLTRVEA